MIHRIVNDIKEAAINGSINDCQCKEKFRTDKKVLFASVDNTDEQ